MKGIKLTQIYLWISINNTAPFISITWHQKEPLDCAVDSHCTTYGSYNKCEYVTKPFGILQRVIKCQKVYISFGHIRS